MSHKLVPVLVAVVHGTKNYVPVDENSKTLLFHNTTRFSRLPHFNQRKITLVPSRPHFLKSVLKFLQEKNRTFSILCIYRIGSIYRLDSSNSLLDSANLCHEFFSPTRKQFFGLSLKVEKTTEYQPGILFTMTYENESIDYQKN